MSLITYTTFQRSTDRNQVFALQPEKISHRAKETIRKSIPFSFSILIRMKNILNSRLCISYSWEDGMV